MLDSKQVTISELTMYNSCLVSKYLWARLEARISVLSFFFGRFDIILLNLSNNGISLSKS